MSTPTTSETDSARRPFRLRRRQDDGRRARGRRRGRQPAPYGHLPRPEHVEPEAISSSERAALLAGARARGARAAKGGVYDPWVLGGSDQAHYFAELASLRDRVKERLVEEDARADDDARLAAARIRADATTAKWRSGLAEKERTALREQLERTRAQLDRLAQRAERWQNFRDTVREGFEREWLRRRMTRLQNEAARQAAGALPDHDAVIDEALQAGRTTAGGDAAWAGHRPRSAISRWGTVILLFVLAVVELPVYYTVFENLHGVGHLTKLLSAGLTFATAAVMIIAPHIAGRVLRRRLATGGVRLAVVPALALLTAWGYGAWTLGDLRARVVFKEPPPVQLAPDQRDGLTDGVVQPSGVADSLHLDQHSVTLMFVALLLLSGGIAFLLGLAEEHPYVDAYRSTAERLDRLNGADEADIDRAAHAEEAEQELRARMEDRRVAHEARLRAVDDLYEAAASAYLDGLADAAKDPAITEAVMRLAQRRPLLGYGDDYYPAKPAFGSG